MSNSDVEWGSVSGELQVKFPRYRRVKFQAILVEHNLTYMKISRVQFSRSGNGAYQIKVNWIPY